MLYETQSNPNLYDQLYAYRLQSHKSESTEPKIVHCHARVGEILPRAY